MNLEAYSTDDLLILQEYLAWLQRYRVDVQKGLQCISKTLERKHRERIFIVAGLLSLLENNGTGDGDLAEAVHDTTADAACDIYNAGLERQLNWLLDQGCGPAFILRRLGINTPDTYAACEALMSA